MTRALITGASGFIGSHLAAALTRRGYDVTCLVRANSATGILSKLGVRLVQGDLADAVSIKRAVNNVDQVYHVAGAVKAVTAKQLWDVNAAGTRNVADACAARQTPPTLVYVSSIAAAGPSTEQRPLRESDICRPISNYGRSKRGGEVAVARVADRLPATIVRPPLVFGPRDRNTLLMVRPVWRFGTLSVPGSRQRRYSFIHSEDLADALVAAAEKGRRIQRSCDQDEGFQQGCYFAAYGRAVTYCQFGNLVADIMERSRLRIVRAPDRLVRFTGRCFDLVAHVCRKPQIFSLDKAIEATAGSWSCSTELIRRECEFSSVGSLETRLQQTIEWLFDNRWLRSRRARDRDALVEDARTTSPNDSRLSY